MKKLLFICHGNICRSPMAEFVMKDLVKSQGKENQYEIQSAAVSREEIGNPVYGPAQRELQKHGITSNGKTARQVRPEDYEKFDWIIYMEEYNWLGLIRILGGDPEHKCRRLLDFTDTPGDIDDPWYTRDFQRAYDQIRKGCQFLMKQLEEEI